MALNPEAMLYQFMAETSLISILKKTWTQYLVNFDCTSDNLLATVFKKFFVFFVFFVRFVVQGF